jgi:hypothetical protein
MSLEMRVFLQKQRVPTTASWQSAVDSLGLPLRLSPDLDPIHGIFLLGVGCPRAIWPRNKGLRGLEAVILRNQKSPGLASRVIFSQSCPNYLLLGFASSVTRTYAAAVDPNDRVRLPGLNPTFTLLSPGAICLQLELFTHK